MAKPNPHVVKAAGRHPMPKRMHGTDAERRFNKLMGDARRDREKPGGNPKP